MIKLKFVVDARFLATYIIKNYQAEQRIPYAEVKYKKDIIAFQNFAYEKSKEMNRLVDGRQKLSTLLLHNDFTNYETTGRSLDNYLREIIASDEFKLIKTQTDASVPLIKSEWEKNYNQTQKYIQELGINISGEFTVYVTHPGLKAGNYNGDNTIIWAHQTYWPNYNTVYLWHELLHAYFKSNDTTHALIELITDNYMRVLLNGGTYPPYEGHKYLDETRTKLLPEWQKYLDSKRKDMQEFLRELDEKNNC